MGLLTTDRAGFDWARKVCFHGPMGSKPPLRADELICRTARLRLNLIVQTDAEELFQVLDDPALHRFTGGAPLRLEELRQRIATWDHRQSPDGDEVWLNWTVRMAATAAVVGYVQASVTGHVAVIAYVIGSAYSGQGFASEATLAMCRVLRQRLFVEELVAHIHPLHQTSQHVARRVGLIWTGFSDAEGEEIWKLRLATHP